MRAALLSITALLAPATLADAKCMMMEAAPKLVTPASATIPADGGVLVEQELVHDAERFDGDASIQPSWGLDIETLAPGLSVYRDKKSKTAIAIPTKKKQTFKVGAASANPLTPPVPTSLAMTVAQGFRGGDAHMITATFSAIPTGAVALVLYKLDGTKRVPQSYGDVHTTTVRVYADPGHCGWNPPGTLLPAVTDKVALAWVDQYGRLSPVSAPLTIQLSKTP